MEISYWEKTQLLTCDIAVVGGGITGLSAAISLKEKFPKASIWLLEQGGFPSGASTRNAGFACFGSLTELLYDAQNEGIDAMLQLVERRYKGLHLLRQRVGDQKLKYEACGGFELITDKEIIALQQLEQMNRWLKDMFPGGVFKERKDLIATFGFAKEKVQTVVWNQHEGQLNTGAMMQCLIDLASECGIRLWTGVKVLQVSEKVEEGIMVQLPGRTETVRIRAGKRVICGNAFTGQFFPEYQKEIVPGRGLVLLTEPIPNLPFKGAFHYDEGFFYFRDLDGRLLIGGGRNLDMKAEQTWEAGINPTIKQALLNMISELVLPGQHPKIDMEWSGIMAFGPERKPILKKLAEHTVVVARLGGMGVALGSLLGQEAAGLLD